MTTPPNTELKSDEVWARELRRAFTLAPEGTLRMIEPWIRRVQHNAMLASAEIATKNGDTGTATVIRLCAEQILKGEK